MLASILTVYTVSALLGLVALSLVLGMAVSRANSLDEMQAPAGPLVSGAMQYARGSLVLVAGTQTDAVPQMTSPSAQVFVTRRVLGGAAGDLRATWNGTIITVTSASGTDTSTIDWLLID